VAQVVVEGCRVLMVLLGFGERDCLVPVLEG